MPTRAEIEEFKNVVRHVDELRESERLKNHPDQNWYMPRKGDVLDLAIDEMRKHPLYRNSQTTYPYATGTVTLAQIEIEREDNGKPYWGEPYFRTKITDRGYNVCCSFPKPGIEQGNESKLYEVIRNFSTKLGVRLFVKKQTKRWDKYARRLISAGEYDKLVGWEIR